MKKVKCINRIVYHRQPEDAGIVLKRVQEKLKMRMVDFAQFVGVTVNILASIYSGRRGLLPIIYESLAQYDIKLLIMVACVTLEDIEDIEDV